MTQTTIFKMFLLQCGSYNRSNICNVLYNNLEEQKREKNQCHCIIRQNQFNLFN